MRNTLTKQFGMAQALIGLLLCILPLPIIADAGSMTITPYIGYRDGGKFEDAGSDSTLDVDDSGTLGLILGWEVEGGQFEISYSRQQSELANGSSVPSARLADVDIANLMAAGKLFLDPGSGSYVSVLLGFTDIDIDADELDSNTRPALGFGGGIDRRINDKLGFRLGLRGIVTFLGTDETDLCASSSNCPILIDGSSLVQWELFAGLGIRF